MLDNACTIRGIAFACVAPEQMRMAVSGVAGGRAVGAVEATARARQRRVLT